MIAELIVDAEKGLTLQESATYRTAQFDAVAVDEALRALSERPDFSRYHVLMALRRQRPDAYRSVTADVRARVLTGALGHVRWLNDFGYLDPNGSFDDVSGQALLETGQPAVSYLIALMRDERPAPLRGSEAATMSQLYGYRRCDYAYRYLYLIRGDEPIFDEVPAQRDQRIRELQDRLKGPAPVD